jgi:hypothetical protein
MEREVDMALVRSAAERRYLWRTIGACGAYAITLVLANYLIKVVDVASPAAIVAAIIPAICVLGFFWALGRLLVEETDEYLRNLLVRQLLVASAFAMAVATTWGFLEDFDLVRHVPAWYIVPLFLLGQALGGLFNKVTVGDTGC